MFENPQGFSNLLTALFAVVEKDLKFVLNLSNLINIFRVNSGCNREIDGQTIHPTEIFNSMNLLQMSCMIHKGQLISKRFFGVVDFLQKTNKNMSYSSKNEFIRSFFGGN